MQVIKKSFGDYQTNCYIATVGNKDFIIDPGADSAKWIIQNVHNPVAILNTHGHFDHIWCNTEIKNALGIPIVTPEDDAFMLEEDVFGLGMPTSKADILAKRDETLHIGGEDITFHHFPGHTPGCSMIELGGAYFSGDFIFNGSIGRYDFPCSSAKDMKKSLEKFMRLEGDKKIYPGHGDATTLEEEKLKVPYWIRTI